MKEIYLLRDWTDTKIDDSGQVIGDPVNRIVYGSQIIKDIAAAKTAGRKISVYTIGECLLDWS